MERQILTHLISRLWVGFLMLGASLRAAPIDVASQTNGGAVSSIAKYHWPNIASPNTLNNVIDTAAQEISPGYDATYVGADQGKHADLVFKFGSPASIERIQLVVNGSCAFWKTFDALPQKIVLRFFSGDRREITFAPGDYVLSAGSAVRIVKNISPPVVSDGVVMEILDLMNASDAPEPNCFSNGSFSAHHGIEFFGEPTTPDATLSISNITYTPGTKTFCWQTNKPTMGRISYYGDVGSGVYDRKTVGMSSPMGTSHCVALENDFVSGYVIVSNVDANGNTVSTIPDDVLFDNGLVGVPYQDTGHGILLAANADIPTFQKRDGIGAAAQFGYIWLGPEITNANNVAFNDYVLRLTTALNEGLSPVILFNWFGFASFCSFSPPKVPRHPFTPADSCDATASATIRNNYYLAVKRLAELVAALPNNHRVLIALEPEWNTMDSSALNTGWDEVMNNAIDILRLGEMPDGSPTTSAGGAKIGTNPYAMETRTLTMNIAMPTAAARFDFIGFHKHTADFGGIDAFQESLTLCAEQAFQSFLKPILFYAPCNFLPSFTEATQAEALSYHFNNRTLIANSFNKVQLYYPNGTGYREAWDQSRLFGIIGPTFVGGGGFDYALNSATQVARTGYFVWKKSIEDTFAAETHSPELTAGPLVVIPSNTQALIYTLYDEPCQIQIYYGPNATVGSAPWTSFRYTQASAWSGTALNPTRLLTGLTASTTYHARVRAMLPNGVIDCSPDFTFTTTTSPLPTATPFPTPTPTPTPTPVPTPFHNAELVGHTIPTVLVPGQSLTVDITMRNTGNITWTPETNHLLGVEFSSGSQIVTATRFQLNDGASIAPNQTARIHIYLNPSGSPGSGTVRFRMLQEGVEWFGQSLQLTISIQFPPNALSDWSVYE